MLAEVLSDQADMVQLIIQPLCDGWRMSDSDRSARIVLIPKPEKGAYRPLAIGNTIGRLKECLLKNELETAIRNKNIKMTNIHGFIHTITNIPANPIKPTTSTSTCSRALKDITYSSSNSNTTADPSSTFRAVDSSFMAASQ